MRLRRLFTLVVGSLVSTALAQASPIDACTSVITKIPSNYSVRINSDAYRNSVFSKYCRADGSTISSTSNIGLSAVVEEISGAFSLSGTTAEEKMSSFCREYAAEYASSSNQLDYSERAVTRAYESYDQCVQLANRSGAQLWHSVESVNSLNFYVAPPSDRPLRIKGVNTSEDVKCMARTTSSESAINMDIREIPGDINLRTGQSLSISCTRQRPQVVDGDVVYEESFATVQTNLNPNGNYTAWLPADTLYPENKASTLDNAIKSLEESSARLQSELETAQSGLVNAENRLANVEVEAQIFTTGFPVLTCCVTWYPGLTATQAAALQSPGPNWTLDSIELVFDQRNSQIWMATYKLVP